MSKITSEIKKFLILSKRHPIATVLTVTITLLITSSIIGVVFTWPSLGLLQYALGLTAGFKPAEIALFAAQYGSALSFWGSLGLATGLLCAVTFALTSLVQLVARVTSAIIGLINFDNPSADDQAKVDKIVDDLCVSPEEITNALISHYATSKEGQEKLQEQFTNASCIEEVKAYYQEHLKGALIGIMAQLLQPAMNKISADRQQAFFKHCGQSFETRYRDRIATLFDAFLDKYAQEKGNNLLGTKVFGDEVFTKDNNPYSLLKVNQNATEDEIKAAFKKMAVKYHPDKNGGKQSPQWAKVASSQKILLNKTTRKNIDSILASKGIIVEKQPEKAPDNNNIDNKNVKKPDAPLAPPVGPIQDKPVVVTYWQGKIAKFLALAFEALTAKKLKVKGKRNALLKEWGITQEDAFYENLEAKAKEKSILSDEMGHVKSTDEKMAPALETLNYKAQVYFLRDAKTKKMPNGILKKNYPAELDYHALEGKDKVNLKKK